ncbi:MULTISPECIES: adenosylcobinamide-GDP ribazoletransferase [unclassified Sinorhizobium]|uniref:adenosylcobinamide-GDP ribazoletransferase n=1 Tax=unclassified Sinorhizobium TaxID=2613772 RepID=UPI0035258792
MGVRKYGDDVARAIAFLSRLPVPQRFFLGHDGKLTRVARTFPTAGLLIALPAALTLVLVSSLHADPLLAVLLTLAVQTLATGALHEDGLADTADGLGGRDRERALAIMKDSHIGTYGVIVLLLSFGIRAAALAQIVRDLAPATGALCLLATAAISRGALVWHWYVLPAAKPDGVAAAAGKPDEASMQIALVTGGLVAALLLWPALSLPPLIFSLLAAATVAAIFTAHVRKRLSGHTGDTLGAMQQICEIAVLATLAMAS